MLHVFMKPFKQLRNYIKYIDQILFVEYTYEFFSPKLSENTKFCKISSSKEYFWMRYFKIYFIKFQNK